MRDGHVIHFYNSQVVEFLIKGGRKNPVHLLKPQKKNGKLKEEKF